MESYAIAPLWLQCNAKLGLNANGPIFHAKTHAKQTQDILPSFTTAKEIKLNDIVGQLPHGNNPGYSLQILSYCLILFMDYVRSLPNHLVQAAGWVGHLHFQTLILAKELGPTLPNVPVYHAVLDVHPAK